MIVSCPQDVSTLYRNPLFSDITVSIHGTELPAHRIILAAQSAYFKALLTSNPSPLLDVEDDQFYLILEWIYGTSLRILGARGYVEDAAEYYAIPTLIFTMNHISEKDRIVAAIRYSYPTWGIADFVFKESDPRVVDNALNEIERIGPRTPVNPFNVGILTGYLLKNGKPIPRNLAAVCRMQPSADCNTEVEKSLKTTRSMYCNLYAVEGGTGPQMTRKLCSLQRFFNNPVFSDIMLEVEGERYYCHLALMSESTYIREHFKPGDIKPITNEMLRIVQWFYTRTLNKTNVSAMLATARTMGVGVLIKDIMESLAWKDLWFALAEEGTVGIPGGVLDSVSDAWARKALAEYNISSASEETGVPISVIQAAYNAYLDRRPTLK
jgi:hypothetical protein